MKTVNLFAYFNYERERIFPFSRYFNFMRFLLTSTEQQSVPTRGESMRRFLKTATRFKDSYYHSDTITDNDHTCEVTDNEIQRFLTYNYLHTKFFTCVYLHTKVSKYDHLITIWAPVHIVCRGHHAVRYHGMLEYCKSH